MVVKHANVSDRDDGVALVYALFAVAILTGLVTVFVARAVNESRFSAEGRDFETAIHVAESGSDQVISVANTQTDEEETPTQRPNGEPHIYDPYNEAGSYAPATGAYDGIPGMPGMLTAPVTDDELRAWEEAWVLAYADEAASALLSVERGEAYGIRPCDPAADGDSSDCSVPQDTLDLVFAVGFTPSYDAAGREVRVIKLSITRDFFIPDFALLTEANLKLGGNASIQAPSCDQSTPDQAEATCVADVHVNGNVDTTGSSHSIEGALSASGTVSGSVNAVNGSTAGADEEEVPEVYARDFYRRPDWDNLAPDSGSTEPHVDGYDLCPDGTIRNRDYAANGPCFEPAATDPTNVVWAVGEDTSTSLGWSFKDAGGNPVWSSNAVQAGAFYIYQADAEVNGSAGSGTRSVSIFIEQDPASPDDTGSLSLGGNPDLGAAFPDTLFVVDGDIKMKGTASGGPCDSTGKTADTSDDCPPQKYSGYISVGEQLDVSGNVTLEGSLTVQDLADQHKLVQRQGTISTFVSGSMVLDFDPSLQIDLTGVVTVEYWNEL